MAEGRAPRSHGKLLFLSLILRLNSPVFIRRDRHCDYPPLMLNCSLSLSPSDNIGLSWAIVLYNSHLTSWGHPAIIITIVKISWEEEQEGEKKKDDDEWGREGEGKRERKTRWLMRHCPTSSRRGFRSERFHLESVRSKCRSFAAHEFLMRPDRGQKQKGINVVIFADW